MSISPPSDTPAIEQPTPTSRRSSAVEALRGALRGPGHPLTCPRHGVQSRAQPGAPCPVCHVDELQQAAQADAAVARATARRDALELAVGALQIPPRFTDATFESFRVGGLAYPDRVMERPRPCADCGECQVDGADPTRTRCAVCEARRCEAICRRYASGFLRVLERGTNLVMVGTTGTGKTHLACAIAKYVHGAGHSVVYKRIADISREVRDSYNRRDGLGEVAILAGYSTVQLLILDEIGVQSGSAHELQILTEIIDSRSGRKLPTLCVSNLSRADLANVLGTRIDSRLQSGGSVFLVMDWHDQRRSAP